MAPDTSRMVVAKRGFFLFLFASALPNLLLPPRLRPLRWNPPRRAPRAPHRRTTDPPPVLRSGCAASAASLLARRVAAVATARAGVEARAAPGVAPGSRRRVGSKRPRRPMPCSLVPSSSPPSSSPLQEEGARERARRREGEDIASERAAWPRGAGRLGREIAPDVDERRRRRDVQPHERRRARRVDGAPLLAPRASPRAPGSSRRSMAESGWVGREKRDRDFFSLLVPSKTESRGFSFVPRARPREKKSVVLDFRRMLRESP